MPLIRHATGHYPPYRNPRRIGMLAGWGRYPLVIAEALRRQGCEVYCLGTIGHADPALAEVCNEFPLARAGEVRHAPSATSTATA